MITICLDAGHYGKYNQSPVLPSYYESEMNWKLHLFLKRELQSYGIGVVCTRTEPESDLPLAERGKRAKGCDLLLSLHSNGAQRESADHVVIFTMVGEDDCAKTSNALAKRLAPVITEVMGVRETQYRIAANYSENDRDGDGLLDDNYYGVLFGAQTVDVPALIVEHSFHTNLRSVKWLSSDENLQKLAGAEAKVIADFYGLSKEIYRVQVGAYKNRKNAEKMLVKLKNAGYDGFITQKEDYYKVQVGAYEIKENAKRMEKKLKADGFSTYIETISHSQ
jgi:N-acetylmuramoyl-L-alanine amidase